MKKLLSMMIMAFGLVSMPAFAEDTSPLTAQQAMERLSAGEAVYSCEMKTDWFSAETGQCPCCAMDLVTVSAIEDGNAVFGEGEHEHMHDHDAMMEKK